MTTVATSARIAVVDAWAARASCATADALYVLTQHTVSGTLRMWRSLDGLSWTEQDAAGAPTNASATHPYSLAPRVVSGQLAVAYFTAANTLACRRFDTAANTWAGAILGGAAVSTDVRSTETVRVEQRSDGDVVAVYRAQSAATTFVRAFDGSAWGTAQTASTQSAVPDAVLAADDRLWIELLEITSAFDAFTRSVSAADVVAATTAHDTDIRTTQPRAVQMAAYHDGTTPRLAFIFRDAGGEYDCWTGSTTGATLSAAAAIGTGITTHTDPRRTSTGALFVGVGAAGRLHLCWSTSNAILRRATNEAAPAYSLTAETTLISGLTDADPAPQWIAGLGFYGVLYQDAGDVAIAWVVGPSATERARSQAIVVA